MAITRINQAGAESNTTSSDVAGNEFDDESNITVTNAAAKTGTYSFQFGNSNNLTRWDMPATRQFRVGIHFSLNLPNAATSAFLSCQDALLNTLFSLRAYGGAENLGIYDSAAAQQDTAVNSYVQDVWYHYGVDVKIDDTAGWVKVYQDGTEILSWTGNTGDVDVTRVFFGPNNLGNNWANNGYFDDAYLDDTTGEAAAAQVPDRRFSYITPDGNGNYSDCMGSDGDQVNNYLLVDDRPHNSDTDYTYADAVGEADTYTMTTVAVAAGNTIAAVIPYYYAKKTDSGTDTEITPRLRYNATDDDGTSVDVGTSYTAHWERFTTKPDGGAWTQAAVDGLEVGFVGSGTF